MANRWSRRGDEALAQRLVHPLLLAAGLLLVAQPLGRLAAGAALLRVPAALETPSAPPAPAAGSPPAVPAGPAPAAPAPGPPEPLTGGDVLDGFPDWSPDGTQIVFMRDGRTWVMAADGSSARPLAAGRDTWDTQPSWSPDGRWIALIRHPQDGKSDHGQLVRMRADGTGEQVLVEAGEPLGYLAWHPGGEGIAFTTRGRLVHLDLRTRMTRILAEAGPEGDLLPGGVAWSPDGQWLVFGSGRRHPDRLDLDLYRVPAAGGEPERLTTGGGIMPHVSPDGRKIAFRSPHRQSGIHVLDLDSGQTAVRQPDQRADLYFHPRWSPDGTRLLASRLNLRSDARGVHVTSAIVVLR
ncbi:hypothetical protein [Caldinitratiruptor microaerophilus]|uniref:WD40-like Beta Propeller Repeat n=1 Tax=Caldinitratiruptor microaerophilus TaxID=671077 RepID=A0AA35CJ13_9FIRM|nr:hypothetical protein [Caldinitratiruptor microaerophilus]BDG60077.1 hypothetical protein caldi_11670 [Caldinitratiruptor microaerophilus]